MKNYYLLTIPVAIGIIAGLYLYNLSSESKTTDEIKLTPSTLIENGSPILGDESAPITIVEWGDYQCTFCYKFHHSSFEIINLEYIQTGKVNLVFKDFPLNGPDSVFAAEAAYCAEDQGKYWEYHDELYANWAGEKTGWITKDSLNGFAKSVGLDLEKFDSCLVDHKYKNRVLALEKFANEIGVRATPTFLIFDDKKVIKIEGNQPIDVFRRAIEEF